jgi:hypothetical protein
MKCLLSNASFIRTLPYPESKEFMPEQHLNFYHLLFIRLQIRLFIPMIVVNVIHRAIRIRNQSFAVSHHEIIYKIIVEEVIT